MNDTDGINYGRLRSFLTHLKSLFATKDELTTKQDTLTAAQQNAADSGITSAKVSGYDSHLSNSTVHVTAADKTAWNGKQSALSTDQLEAANSGITASKVSDYDGHIADSDIHVTAGDKSTWNGKANDADVVHIADAETITGAKTFSEWVNASGFQQTNTTITTDVAPSSTQFFGYNYSNNSDGKTLLRHRAFVYANTLNNILRYWVLPNTSVEDNYGGFQVIAYGDGSTIATFKPRGNVEPYDVNYGANLGTSANKWKSLNGVNPGALSLPSSSYVDISSSITNLSGGTNPYTPPSDGWLYIAVPDVAGNFIAITATISMTLPGTGTFNTMRYCLPVTKDVPCTIFVKATSLSAARFYPCLGNV